MSFLIYMIGFLIFIGGVSWALVLMGVQTTYVIVTAVILVGLGILTGVAKTRTKDV
jgi:hypothetical protein